jgi:hypothetical protein
MRYDIRPTAFQPGQVVRLAMSLRIRVQPGGAITTRQHLKSVHFLDPGFALVCDLQLEQYPLTYYCTGCVLRPKREMRRLSISDLIDVVFLTMPHAIHEWKGDLYFCSFRKICNKVVKENMIVWQRTETCKVLRPVPSLVRNQRSWGMNFCGCWSIYWLPSRRACSELTTGSNGSHQAHTQKPSQSRPTCP